MLVTVDLTPSECDRCGAKHRSEATQISCYYPNADGVRKTGKRLTWVVADIFAHYDSRRGTDTLTVYLTIFDTRSEAEQFDEDREYSLGSTFRETRIVPFGTFIPGASKWADAPSRRRK